MFREQLYCKIPPWKSQRLNKANSLFKLFDLRKEVKRFNVQNEQEIILKKGLQGIRSLIRFIH